jgi:hypothetical protein
MSTTTGQELGIGGFKGRNLSYIITAKQFHVQDQVPPAVLQCCKPKAHPFTYPTGNGSDLYVCQSERMLAIKD